MTVHRSTTMPTPELYSRASLLFDGARLPLAVVADTLGLPPQRVAHCVALGRLREADRVIVLPKGCGPHLAGLVSGDPASALHVLGCDTCTEMEDAMGVGIAVARRRWTGEGEPDDVPAQAPAPAEPDPQPAATSPPATPRAPAPAEPDPQPAAASPPATPWAPPPPAPAPAGAAVPPPPQQVVAAAVAVPAAPPPPPPADGARRPWRPPSTAPAAAVEKPEPAEPAEPADVGEPADATTTADISEPADAPATAIADATTTATADTDETAEATATAEPTAPSETTAQADTAAAAPAADPADAQAADDGWLPAHLFVAERPAGLLGRRPRAVAASVAGAGLLLAGMTAPSALPSTAATAVVVPEVAAAADGTTDAERSVESVLRRYQARPTTPVVDGLAPPPADLLRVGTAPAPEPLAPPAPAPQPVARTHVDPYAHETWDRLAACESSGDWAADTGNGFYGGLQFQLSSWQLVGGQGMPHEAPREEQISRAIALWEIQGWPAWPVCSRRLGFR